MAELSKKDRTIAQYCNRVFYPWFICLPEIQHICPLQRSIHGHLLKTRSLAYIPIGTMAHLPTRTPILGLCPYWRPEQWLNCPKDKIHSSSAPLVTRTMAHSRSDHGSSGQQRAELWLISPYKTLTRAHFIMKGQYH